MNSLKSLFLFSFFLQMESKARWRKKNVESDGHASLSYSILPGGQAREYTVRSSARIFNIMDLFGFISLCYLLWVKLLIKR